MVAMRRIGLERRKGNHSGAEELFYSYMEEASSTEERNYYAQKYARYQAKVKMTFSNSSLLSKHSLQTYNIIRWLALWQQVYYIKT